MIKKVLYLYMFFYKIIIGNSEDFSGSKLNLEPSDKTLLFHDTAFPAEKFEKDLTSNIKSVESGNSNPTHKGNLVPLKIDLLQKLNPTNIVKPLQEKITKVKESLLRPNNPAYGGVQGWSPDQIWEKIHETGHNFITGINGAIYGLIHPLNHDYPFPYRMMNKS